ncbi:hypothetical protein GCM10023143_19830 [Compostibacter hankyongensis]|uniref:Uncharacterized protein n=1 Tax=Compostibacter hankyongensis TaxID=1007089 RepID=A0ABP8FU08_9BACT
MAAVEEDSVDLAAAALAAVEPAEAGNPEKDSFNNDGIRGSLNGSGIGLKKTCYSIKTPGW